MAHPEQEAIEVVDVSSAARAIEQMDGIFDEQIEETEEVEQEDTVETQEEEISEEEQVAPEEQASEEDSEETQTDEELEEAIQAPVTMDQSEKEIFSEASPKIQQWALRRDAEQNKGLQQKFTELAELRKSTAADQQRIEQERQSYVSNLDMLMQQSLPPKPDMQLLNPQSEAYNPEQYHLAKAQHESGLEYVQGLQQERDRVAKEQQEANNQRFTEYVNEQDRILTENMPEWSNPETKKQIVKYATDFGYTADQLKQASAQDIQLLRKGQLYDQLMAKKPVVQEQLKTVPKVTKPGAKVSKASKFEARQAKFNRLQKSGSIDDAAKVLHDLI